MRTPVKNKKRTNQNAVAVFWLRKKGKGKGEKRKVLKEKKDGKHTKEDTRNLTRTEQEKNAPFLG